MQWQIKAIRSIWSMQKQFLGNFAIFAYDFPYTAFWDIDRYDEIQ